MNVKTLCLGILSCGDASGYEIKKSFEESFSHFYAAGYGSIYPALSELHQDGHVDCTGVEQQNRPAKKVYSLTQTGREYLLETLQQVEPDHRIRSAFMVLILFSHLLPAERLEWILQKRIDDSQTMLDYIAGCSQQYPDDPAAQFVTGFASAALRAGMEYVQNNRESFLEKMNRQTTMEKAS